MSHEWTRMKHGFAPRAKGSSDPLEPLSENSCGFVAHHKQTRSVMKRIAHVEKPLYWLTLTTRRVPGWRSGVSGNSMWALEKGAALPAVLTVDQKLSEWKGEITTGTLEVEIGVSAATPR